MSKISETQLQEIIEALQGTCDTLDGIVQVVMEDDNICTNDLTPEQLEELDQQIFLCETCGWWYEISEMSDEDQVCQDCDDED